MPVFFAASFAAGADADRAEGGGAFCKARGPGIIGGREVTTLVRKMAVALWKSPEVGAVSRLVEVELATVSGAEVQRSVPEAEKKPSILAPFV